MKVKVKGQERKNHGGLHRRDQIDPGPEQRQINLSFVFLVVTSFQCVFGASEYSRSPVKETARRKRGDAGHSPHRREGRQEGRQAGRQNTWHDNAYRRRENPDDAMSCQTRNTGHGAKQPPCPPAYGLLSALCLPFPQFVTLPARNSSCSS